MNIGLLIEAINEGKVKVTNHADEEMANDNLFLDDVYQALLQGQVIENYPNDKPFPSCLVYGPALNGSAVHSVWAYNEQNQWAVLITVYRPDPDRWINWYLRKM